MSFIAIKPPDSDSWVVPRPKPHPSREEPPFFLAPLSQRRGRGRDRNEVPTAHRNSPLYLVTDIAPLFSLHRPW